MLMQEGKWMQRKEMRKIKMDGGVRRSEARDLPKSKRFWERTGKMTVNAKSIPSWKKWGKLAERMQMSWGSEHRHYSHKGNYRSRSRAYSEDSRLLMSLGSILNVYDGVFQNVLKKIVNRPKFRGMIWRFFPLNQKSAFLVDSLLIIFFKDLWWLLPVSGSTNEWTAWSNNIHESIRKIVYNNWLSIPSFWLLCEASWLSS